MSEENGTFYASFQPQEAGEWRIHVTYDNQDIDNSPFKCMVFNPRAIFVRVFKQFMASIGAFIGIIDRTLLNGKFEGGHSSVPLVTVVSNLLEKSIQLSSLICYQIFINFTCAENVLKTRSQGPHSGAICTSVLYDLGSKALCRYIGSFSYGLRKPLKLCIGSTDCLQLIP